jgi:hypothetical protein
MVPLGPRSAPGGRVWHPVMKTVAKAAAPKINFEFIWIKSLNFRRFTRPEASRQKQFNINIIPAWQTTPEANKRPNDFLVLNPKLPIVNAKVTVEHYGDFSLL